MPERPTSKLPTSEALASSSRVADCEWKAAHRYDDAGSAVTELARQIMGVCAIELIEMPHVFGLSLHDPHVDMDEFKNAVEW